MSYRTGQRFGHLTVTQTTQHGIAEQVRCDCGSEIRVRLEFSFLAPPDEIGHYHARWLLAAEAGQLRYNPRDYPIHAVPNNAADALWRGLLVDAAGGPVLTELGAHMLAHWKQTQPDTKTALAPETGPASTAQSATVAPLPRSDPGSQLDLFVEVP